MADTVANLLLGLEVALRPMVLFYVVVGVGFGMIVGVLPGIGAMAAIALLLPITYYLDPTSAIVMIAGIYYGTAYGGSTASILLNVPGKPSAAVTCLDGYPMARQGRGGIALLMTAVASFVGAMVGLVVLLLFAPIIATFSTRLGPSEYFSLILLGLIASSSIASGSQLKSLAMMILGLVIGSIGTDVGSGTPRFHFGSLSLRDGVSIVAIAMGLFALTEVVRGINNVSSRHVSDRFTFRSMLPTLDDWRRSVMPAVRGSGIGSFFGSMPGTGMDVGAFVAYGVEKRVSKTPERFGKGAVEGVVAPEVANNAAAQTAFVPTLTLGIPGDAVMALVLGALILHGITPGPRLITEEPELFWGLIGSFIIGNLVLLVMNIPLVGLWVKILAVPFRLLYPAIVILVCVGVYSVNNNPFDVFMAALFGLGGYVFIWLGFGMAPLLLGVVLGPMLEERFVRALVIARGDPTVFVTRPISALFIGLCVLLLTWIVYDSMRTRRETRP